mgnify:CR=1 FL=1
MAKGIKKNIDTSEIRTLLTETFSVLRDASELTDAEIAGVVRSIADRLGVRFFDDNINDDRLRERYGPNPDDTGNHRRAIDLALSHDPDRQFCIEVSETILSGH